MAWTPTPHYDSEGKDVDRMERLTKWNESSNKHAYYPRCFEGPCYGSGCKIKDCPFETAVCERLAAYEDTGLTPERVVWMKEVVEAAFDNDTSRIERAHDLHVADKEGRVIVLPCKVGDKLYRVFAGEIFEHRVWSMKYFAIRGKWDIETYPFCPFVESSIGKTIFSTREEAEKALAEMEGKKDG